MRIRELITVATSQLSLDRLSSHVNVGQNAEDAADSDLVSINIVLNEMVSIERLHRKLETDKRNLEYPDADLGEGNRGRGSIRQVASLPYARHITKYP